MTKHTLIEELFICQNNSSLYSGLDQYWRGMPQYLACLCLDSCISEYTWVHPLDYDQAFSTIMTTMPASSFQILVSDLLPRITLIFLNFLTYCRSALIFTNLLTMNIFFCLYQCSGGMILISCILLPYFLICHCPFTEKVDWEVTKIGLGVTLYKRTKHN